MLHYLITHNTAGFKIATTTIFRCLYIFLGNNERNSAAVFRVVRFVAAVSERTADGGGAAGRVQMASAISSGRPVCRPYLVSPSSRQLRRLAAPLLLRSVRGVPCSAGCHHLPGRRVRLSVSGDKRTRGFVPPTVLQIVPPGELPADKAARLPSAP